MTVHSLRIHSRRLVTAVSLAGLSALAAVSLAVVPIGRPEDVGLASERLPRITQVMQNYVDSHQVTGAVSIVARRGKIAYFEAVGQMDLEHKTPMRKDAIFRMASMSKPVTGVAILMLMEEGKVRLTDPVSRFIPEFKNLKVAVAKAGQPQQTAAPAPPNQQGQPGRGRGGRGRGAPPPEIEEVPAAREITVRDLLTHTSGLESSGIGNREAGRRAPRLNTDSLATYVPKLAAGPLDFQPGTQWRYSLLAGMETLGRIVEIASGQTFDVFLKTRLFDPLGMKDTGFVVAADKQSRLVTLYERNDAGGFDRQDTPGWLDTTTLFSGGGGLYSTAEDYLQFAQMLVNGGELNGKRFLSPRTVDLMASNHVGDLYRGSGGNVRGMGWGLSVEVVLDPVQANRRTSAGSFGWDGAFGTHFWVDRKEKLTGVMLIQETGGQMTRDFENAVMQAIID
ncbi:MAG TPA: serine hydrolase domain-containing protein [Vicinamibacterales bacterium]|jgi:CubicO group peptidase (beta-lactamase class C family)|nr:serine hydrolase domain-containing protein [Vicinamibacterales bacterium]